MNGFRSVCQFVHSLRFPGSTTRHGERSDEETIRRIRETAASFERLSDRALKDHVGLLRESRQSEASLDLETLVSCFALISEAIRRTLGIYYYDVQLLTGLALSRNAVAEMRTGEGKTLTAALPACVHALFGRGAHVMTVNAYLATRDFGLLEPVYQSLGISAGVLEPGASADEKRAAYAREITYGPGYEFGFDYLRDQLALLDRPKPRLGNTYRQLMQGRELPPNRQVQRGHHFAVVDEADCVMIDEATTPLILSGTSSAAASTADAYRVAMQMADRLEGDRDYLLDANSRLVCLTERGLQTIGEHLGAIPAEGLRRPWPEYVEQALRAKFLLKRDVDYLVSDDTILLVDQSTGRVFTDRSWRDGLRQAVEMREGIPCTLENQTVARISRQRFLGLYEGLCGLTGTAAGSQREFSQVYGLPVVPIRLRTPSRRVVFCTRFFADATSKWAAIVREIERIHRTGQPILVGTRTIEASERLARQLDAGEIGYRLLNGKQDADEASIVARAGEPKAITVATNMAGRGTDIKLIGEAKRLGGLHVIGSEPHESTRVDRQLMGRSARQGDPGSCQFFASADDRLIAASAPGLARRMRRLASHDGEIGADFTSEIVALQQRVERRAFAARRQLAARDRWMEEVLDKLAEATPP